MSPWVVALLAVVLAGVAGALLPGDAEALLHRLGAWEVARGAQRRAAVARCWPGTAAAVAPGVMAGVGAGVGAGSLAVGAAAGLIAWTAARMIAGRATRRRVGHGQLAAIALVGALAAELRGGAEPRAALAAVAVTDLPAVAAAARSPVTDVPAALVLAARGDGAELLADLAAAWRVAEATGSGLAGPSARLAVAARESLAVRRELDAQLAGPRASALLLSLLPLAGIGLGTALGADPIGFLLSTPTGRGALLVGAVLVSLGVAWTEQIVRRAAG